MDEVEYELDYEQPVSPLHVGNIGVTNEVDYEQPVGKQPGW